MPERFDLPARTLQAGLDALFLVAFAGYWFGNTGIGLAALWLASRQLPGRFAAPDSFEHLTPVCLTAQRALLRAEDGRRLEVFRDELSPARWAALKRLFFQPQL